MRSRRRFRGYCPPVTRRAYRYRMTGVGDDYITSLSLGGPGCAVKPSQLHHTLAEATAALCPPPSSLDGQISTLIQKTKVEVLKDDSEALNRMGVRRRRRSSIVSRDDGYVTSLAIDHETRDQPERPLSHQRNPVWKADNNTDTWGHDSQSETSNGGHADRRRDEVKKKRFPQSIACPSPADAAGEQIMSASMSSLHVKEDDPNSSFASFRLNYLIVHIAIMLADGLQGTHLYVLYEGYGYSVATLYCLGFVSGALTSPVTGPLVDKIGRKKSALLYCFLEVVINLLEQYPHFAGLIVSRVVGGITTNLLFTVFESWLVTEHRRRGFAEEKLETVLRDSVVVSNLAAIASGYLAHVLADRFGPVGPFEGAVTCTAMALFLVMMAWTENYGSAVPGVKSVGGYMADAVNTIVSDSKISRIGIIQGLTEGSLQTFVFLWSPALRHFATKSHPNVLCLDKNGEPAYGLIFGAFMACGVLGGLSEPYIRKLATMVFSCSSKRGRETSSSVKEVTVEIDGEGEIQPAAVEFLAAFCYIVCAGLLLTPYVVSEDWEYAFSVSLAAFLMYEYMVGLYMPCEGIIRSIYMPTASMCSLMTMLRVIVNVAVAIGVISTNFIPFATAFASVSSLMIISAAIQVTLGTTSEFSRFLGGVSFLGRKARSVSFATRDAILSKLYDTSLMRELSSSSLPPPSKLSRESSVTSVKGGGWDYDEPSMEDD